MIDLNLPIFNVGEPSPTTQWPVRVSMIRSAMQDVCSPRINPSICIILTQLWETGVSLRGLWYFLGLLEVNSIR